MKFKNIPTQKPVFKEVPVIKREDIYTPKKKPVFKDILLCCADCACESPMQPCEACPNNPRRK